MVRDRRHHVDRVGIAMITLRAGADILVCASVLVCLSSAAEVVAAEVHRVCARARMSTSRSKSLSKIASVEKARSYQRHTEEGNESSMQPLTLDCGFV